MSDDLVKRLRDVAEATGPNDARQIALDAADRIEELEAKLDWVITERDETFALMLDRVQTAEAKLAKAVEALEVIDALDPEGFIDGFSQFALRGLVLRMGESARTILAELKGETDAA